MSEGKRFGKKIKVKVKKVSPDNKQNKEINEEKETERLIHTRTSKEENEREEKQIGKIKHKAEPTRHFPRYRIPAYIEINGKRYKLKDWSLGGCSIIGLEESILNKKWAEGNLIFPFDSFDTTVKGVKLEFIRRSPDGTVGCRFTELRPDQVSIIQDVIEAYLEGTVEASLDEFINIVRREDLREALESRRPEPPKKNLFEERLRRGFILGLFATISFILIVFILEALHTRIYIIHPVSSFYDADLKVIRTPENGFFITKHKWKVGEKVWKRRLLGYIKSPFLGTFSVLFPLSGTIAKVHAVNLEPVVQGDALITMLPYKSPIYIRSNVVHQDTDRLKIGQEVEVIQYDGKVLKGKVVDVEGAPMMQTIHVNQPSYSYTWNYDKVKIQLILPEEERKKFDVKKIGKSVFVVIDVSPWYLKPIFWLLP